METERKRGKVVNFVFTQTERAEGTREVEMLHNVRNSIGFFLTFVAITTPEKKPNETEFNLSLTCLFVHFSSLFFSFFILAATHPFRPPFP